DVDGEVVNAYAYDPYGEVLSAEETVENPYRYAGYRYDEPTGLYYLWNRYYDPETCRFLTRDPYPGELDSPMSMNPYLYCLGDPVNLVDPTGWCAENRLSDSWRLSTPTDTDWAFMLAGSLCDLLGLVGLIAPPAGWAFFAAGVAMDVANIQRVLGLRSEDRATRGDVIAAVAGIMPGVTPYTAQMHMMQGFGQWITPWDTGFYAHP
ncbi:MAG: RHS repeat-associated core domain-containing protein, partial [Coriobacteriia bacterium]|nr:RHS repeat-associated core domain-containing protein [Coriobacteriia bacterium]